MAIAVHSTHDLAAPIVENAPIAVYAAKHAIDEGLKAFAEKRKPVYRGR